MLARGRVDTPGALTAAGWQKGSQHTGTGTWRLPVLPAVGAGSWPRAEALGHSRNPSNAFLRKEVTQRTVPTGTHGNTLGLPAVAPAQGVSAGGT